MSVDDPAGVAAVVLAAGSSSRLGRPKQLLLFRGETLLRRAARAALDAGCRPVVVVTGANGELSGVELRGLDVREVFNARWETGMASSVRAGVEAVLEAAPKTAAIVLTLCDQPYVTGEVLAGLVAAHRATGSAVVASEYGGSFGAPALFARPLFAELARLEGDGGAKRVIRSHASEVKFVHFQGGEVDVDTEDDFSRLPRGRAGR